MKFTVEERGHAAALAAVVIWALVPAGTRFFVLRVDPYLFNIIRFAASGAAALPFFLFAKPWRWSTNDRWLLLACAVLAVPGYNVPVALGAKTVPAGELGVLIATEPVMIAALTSLWHRQPVHWRVAAGSMIALLGVMLTSGILSGPQQFRWNSTLQVLLGAFCWSLYTVLAGSLNKRHGTFGVTGSILVVGSALLFAVSLPMVDSSILPDRVTLMLLAIMGLSSSLIGFLLWNFAGAVVPAERLGLFLYMLPVVSILAGVQFLSESLTVQFLFGGLLTLAGVWFASRTPRGISVVLTE